MPLLGTAQTGTYHPYLGGRVKHLGLSGKEGHALSRDALFIGLVRDVCAVLRHDSHPPQGLGVVYEGLVECFRERRIGDVYVMEYYGRMCTCQ